MKGGVHNWEQVSETTNKSPQKAFLEGPILYDYDVIKLGPLSHNSGLWFLMSISSEVWHSGSIHKNALTFFSIPCFTVWNWVIVRGMSPWSFYFLTTCLWCSWVFFTALICQSSAVGMINHLSVYLPILFFPFSPVIAPGMRREERIMFLNLGKNNRIT